MLNLKTTTSTVRNIRQEKTQTETTRTRRLEAMPLAYDIRQPLVIPDAAFNKDGIATILIQGGRYGGEWVMNAIALDGGPIPDDAEVIGSIHTEKDERPGMAVDTAFVWVNDVCVKAGWKLAHVTNHNDKYGPSEAPFFAAASFLIDRR
jgi:hypothetical protein